MRHLSMVMLTAISFAIGCSQDHSVTSPTRVATVMTDLDASVPTSGAIILEPAELEKLSDWDATSKATAMLTESLATIMSDIHDPESAAAAIPKLRQLAPKFAAIQRAENTFGTPSAEDQALVWKNLGEANRLFDQHYVPLTENDELRAIVGQAIDDAYVGEITE
ncbi:MAG: hypothetical protein AAGJ40_07520 [Planctomycetota bacterium]